MPRNLELKVKLDSFNEINNKLKEMNALPQGILNQRDIYYKNNCSFLKLRFVNDSAEMIIYERDEKNSERWSNYKVLEVEKSNAEEFFNSIFESETEVKKKRNLYIYKNTRIHLDEVKNLGLFLELETVVKDDDEPAVKEFEKIKSFLGLNDFEEIRKSYKNLVMSC